MHDLTAPRLDEILSTATSLFEARAQELAALDARVNDLRLLLSANEEVERLLRGQ